MKEIDPTTTSSPTELTAVVEALVHRVAALERHLGLEPLPELLVPHAIHDPSESQVGLPTGTPSDPAAAPSSPGLELPTVGTAFLLLAGAFLLRALTAAGRISPTAGVVLGLLYVFALLTVTVREAERGLRARAQVFGTALVLVAYPFIWETTTRHGTPSPAIAAVLLALVTGLALGAAARYGFKIFAWLVVLACLTTGVALFWVAGAPLLYLAVILLLGVALVWLGYGCGWDGPQWVAAAAINGLVLLAVLMAGNPAASGASRPALPASGTLLLALALPALYLGSFSVRTLLLHRVAGAFEILQSLGCIVVGVMGAVRLLHDAERGTAGLGWATCVLGVAAYAAAFVVVRSRQGRGLNFFYHAWLGLLLTLIGSALVVSTAWLPMLWIGLGLAASATGVAFNRWTLRLHCAVYLTGAAFATGLLGRFVHAFVTPQPPTWSGITPVAVAAWAFTAIAYAGMAAARRGRDTTTGRRTPRFLVAALTLAGAGTLLVTALAVGPAAKVSGSPEAVTAALRTAVLASMAVLLAALGRRDALRELSWFVKPLLILLAVKILLEDLRRGTPVALFVSFACFGVALIAAPRLLARRPAEGPATDPTHPAAAADPNPEGTHGTDTP